MNQRVALRYEDLHIIGRTCVDSTTGGRVSKSRQELRDDKGAVSTSGPGLKKKLRSAPDDHASKGKATRKKG